MEKALKDQIVMSIPGDYSRKPPLGGTYTLQFTVSSVLSSKHHWISYFCSTFYYSFQ